MAKSTTLLHFPPQNINFFYYPIISLAFMGRNLEILVLNQEKFGFYRNFLGFFIR